MKMRFLIPVFLTCACLSCSQRTEDETDMPRPEFRLLRLHYENSSGEKAVTRFYYDLSGQNYLAVWYLEDSSRSSLNRHTLDSTGRLLTKSREFSDGLRSVQNFTYDTTGNLAHEDFSRSDGVTGYADYFYGPDGKLEAADCRGLNGWFYGKIEYKYEDSIKTGALLVKDSVPFGTIAYEYRDGRLAVEHWDLNGSWSQTFRYEYQDAATRTFASTNVFIREDPWSRILSEYYEFDGKPGGPSTYTYDGSGRLVRKEYLRADGLNILTEYEYDSTGLPVQSHREYGDGRSMDFKYWYTIDRQLLVKTFQGSDSTQGSETYRYKDGKLILGEYVNVDGWLTGTLTFSYDGNGVLSSAVYAGEDGQEALIGFTRDLNLNLVQVHWEFGSGHSQDYTYKYLPD